MTYLSYCEALKKLTSLEDLSHIPNLKFSNDVFTLQRIINLLGRMGNPQNYLKTIHIAGTKGKGSTAAMLESVLRVSGYRVGLFTSPWLFDFREQIQINRVPISERDLIDQVENLQSLFGEVWEITTFEAVTAIAFQYFKDKRVDFGIIEAGLGGQYDATNVINAQLSVITSISYDHTSILGDTIDEITHHKAGIIKSRTPVVMASQVYEESRKIIQDEAARLQSEMNDVDKILSVEEQNHSLDNQVFSASFKNRSSKFDGFYTLSLLGKHQINNAATVLSCLDILERSGYEISKESVYLGLQTTFWPCRFEVISRDPLVILDSAHNVDSAKKLKQTLSEYLKDYEIILLFGSSVDKKVDEILKILIPGIKKVIFIKSNHPRAAEPGMLVELVKDQNVNSYACETIEEALKTAKESSTSRTVIVAAGSVFIAASVRKKFTQYL